MKRSVLEALEPRCLLHAGHEGAHGLLGEYFDNNNLTSIKITRTDPQINFSWFSSSPDSSIAPDTFSVRWTGKIVAPSTETVTFIARVDDGVRLWINNNLIIDKWVVSAPVDRTGTFNMVAGQSYDIRLEYLEASGGAQIQLSWQTPTIAKQLIPSSNLLADTPVEPPPVEDLTNNAANALLRIDSGSSSNFTDSSGNVWVSDRNFSGGGMVSTPTVAVANTVNDPFFNTFHYGNFTYNIPVSNGNYNVKLFFNDPTYTTTDTRYFDVFAENALVLDNFDMVAQGGAKTAFSRTIPVTVSDGSLTLRVATVTGNNSLIAGLAIFANGTTTPPPTDTTTISWTTKAAAPSNRAEALRAVVDNKIFMFGGFDISNGPITRSDVYNPATNSWSPIAPLPDRLTHAGVTVVGRNVYFVGGYVGKGTTGWDQTFGTKKAFRYNVDENKYYDIPYLPVERAGGGLAAIGNELHYFSGDNLSRSNVGDHYVLNLIGGTSWATAAPLPSARSHMGYVTLGGKIYAIGGQKGNDATLTTQSTVSVYDPATNVWTNVAALPRGISHISSSTVVTNTGKIMVLGGESAHNAAVSSVYLYDPSTNKWSTTTSLPGTRFSGVAGFINGKVYFTTGSSQTTTWEGVLS